MSPRRPPRAWIGRPLQTDPSALTGPRGLTAEVLNEPDEPAKVSQAVDAGRAPAEGEPGEAFAAPEGEAAFYWSLFTAERKSRIETVIASRLRSVTVVLDRLLDAHNTAAILRTAEGLGLCSAHVVLHESDDGIAHRRVTQDAHKWIEVQKHDSGDVCARSLRAKGFEVWAGHLDERAILYGELPKEKPIALLFGNEHEGPSRETLSACTGTFRIPMAGFTQSFNVSVAAGIALSHAAEARRAFLEAPGDLREEERAQLKARFTLLAAKLSRRLKR